LAVGAGLDFHPIEEDLHVAVLDVSVGNVAPLSGGRECASVAVCSVEAHDVATRRASTGHVEVHGLAGSATAATTEDALVIP